MKSTATDLVTEVDRRTERWLTDRITANTADKFVLPFLVITVIACLVAFLVWAYPRAGALRRAGWVPAPPGAGRWATGAAGRVRRRRSSAATR